jgi:hypothetical protein
VGVSETLWYRVRILTLHRWGVLWLYTHIGYIENFSTAGISLGQLLELLVDKQLEALIYVGMGRLHIENELSHSLCSGCISFNMQFISISDRDF